MQTHKLFIEPYVLGLISVPGHNLNYLEWGDKTNPNIVICVHGLTRNAHDFDYIAKTLSQDFRVLSISMAGRGESDWFEDANLYNYPVYIADVTAFLQKLNLSQVNWLGTSMGGIIGMSLAAYSPALIKTLILNDIGPEIPGEALRRIGKYVGLNPHFTDLNMAKAHMKIIFKYFGISLEEDWDYITKYSVMPAEEGGYRLNYDPRIAESLQIDQGNPQDVVFWNIWEKIFCDRVLVHGAKSDILKKNTVDQMLTAENVTLYTIDHAGHAPALKGKEEINFIHNWLKQHI